MTTQRYHSTVMLRAIAIACSSGVFGAGLVATAAGCGDEDTAASATTAGASVASSSGSASGPGAASGTGAGGAGAGAGGAGAGAGGSGGSMAAVCPGGPYADTPLPADTAAKVVQGGFDFLEGPVWFADLGALFFSDMHFSQPNDAPLNGPKGTMHELVGGVFTDFIDNSSTNGLGIDVGGKIIACTHDTRSVSRFDPVTKERTDVALTYMGKKFNSPNDVTVRSDGNIYFTDPDWQLTGPSELETAVYRITPANVVELVDTLGKPNGVSLSPDEKTLYVGAVDGKIRSYALAADGSPGAAADFAQVGGPDGFAVDCAGNLYVTGGAGVTVLAPDGSQLGNITGISGSAANAAFGGPMRTTLYITAGTTLYSIELAIPGYPY